MSVKNISKIWGTNLGKIISLCLVLGLAFGAIAISMRYEQHRDVVIDLEELPETDRVISHKDNKITFKFKLDKQGYSFTGFDTYNADDGIVLTMYASLTHGDYSVDADGFYTITIPYTNEDKTLSIKGEDGVVNSVYTIKNGK